MCILQLYRSLGLGLYCFISQDFECYRRLASRWEGSSDRTLPHHSRSSPLTLGDVKSWLPFTHPIFSSADGSCVIIICISRDEAAVSDPCVWCLQIRLFVMLSWRPQYIFCMREPAMCHLAFGLGDELLDLVPIAVGADLAGQSFRDAPHAFLLEKCVLGGRVCCDAVSTIIDTFQVEGLLVSTGLRS